MKNCLMWVAAGCFFLGAAGTEAGTKVTVAYHNNDGATPAFEFKSVPGPSMNDAATTAKFSIVDGGADSNSGGLGKLNDGKLPVDADQPEENFFFDAGSDGGRLRVDLGGVINVRQVNTYSWHPGPRGPQLYKLYAADGTATNFNPAPKRGVVPGQCGWTLVASVDTRPKSGDGGGQYGVSIADTGGHLGRFRCLLFDVSATERDDDFGNTFFSEIDVVAADAPTAAVAAARGTVAPVPGFTAQTADGKCTIAINTELAPGLKEWAESKLVPALVEWYPKITELLASDGYTAPDHFQITLKPMDGVAYTSGRNVVANSEWLKTELDGQAVGSLIHEAVHVVQHFDGENPGWLVEGSADYIRWFKYEPQSHGADLVWLRKHGGKLSPKYNAGYRLTANFLNWVSEKYDQDIVSQMNAAMRENKYDAGLWKKYTGKTETALGDEWKQEVMAQLGQASPFK
ncbi:MAG: basic secretory protein-like protein [Verrucomicrobiae bacterium]|nr:basic secretory protein-like protein [Verrucomicrobiae bacterium]